LLKMLQWDVPDNCRQSQQYFQVLHVYVRWRVNTKYSILQTAQSVNNHIIKFTTDMLLLLLRRLLLLLLLVLLLHPFNGLYIYIILQNMI